MRSPLRALAVGCVFLAALFGLWLAVLARLTVGLAELFVVLILAVLLLFLPLAASRGREERGRRDSRPAQ